MTKPFGALESKLPPVVIRLRAGPTRLTYVPAGLCDVHYATDFRVRHLFRGTTTGFYLAIGWPLYGLVGKDFIQPLVEGGAPFYMWSYLSDTPESFWRDCWRLNHYLSVYDTTSHLYIEAELPVDSSFSVGP